MQCYNELLPPTAVTHAITLPLLGPTAHNLVVARTSLLQVYNIIHPSEPSTVDSKDNVRLVMLGEYPLAGTVTSLARITIQDSQSGGDAFLVSIKDAKMSLIEWDPHNHRISTLSIHYYEDPDIYPAPLGPPLRDYTSKIIVDPRSRCAALSFGVRHLAILPFSQELDNFAEDANGSPPPAAAANQNDITKPTPYAASFVMSLTALDPTLCHPLDLAFLYEYRDPTFGIISSTASTSYGLREQRKDIVTYSVITFDVEQRAATTLLSIKGLPSTITRLIPLSLPVGGALLIGPDQLIHIDQSGKTTGLAFNEFARRTSAFALADHSQLDLKLDHCLIGPLDPVSGTMLIVLQSGQLATLSFRIDGRSVSGLAVHVVATTNGGSLGPPSPVTINHLGNAAIFIGSDQANSIVLSWSEPVAQPTRKRRFAQMDQDAQDGSDLDLDEEMSDDDGADDDLYGGQAPAAKRAFGSLQRLISPENCVFRSHQLLQSLAPISSTCFGSSTKSSNQSQLAFIASVGRASHSRLLSLARELVPSVSASIDIPDSQILWLVSGPPSEGPSYDKHFILQHTPLDSESVTKLYDSGLIEVQGTDFEGEGETVNMGTLASGNRIIQVRKSEIRSYDNDFELSQIYPVLHAITEEELQVVHSSFCDPYLLIIQNDSSIQVLNSEADGEIVELQKGDNLSSGKYISGCVYRSDEHSGDEALLFLLDVEGGLQIYQLPDLAVPAYLAPTLSALPPVLSTESRQRRAAARETLTELIVADLGDAKHKAPYLIVRSATDELTIYECFHCPPHPASVTGGNFTSNLRFRKTPGLHIPKYDEAASAQGQALMRAMSNVGGYATVSVCGASPSFILKEATGLPRIVNMAEAKNVKSMATYHTSDLDSGFAYLDDTGCLHKCLFPEDTTYIHAGWAVKELNIDMPGQEVHQIAFHAEADRYVIVTSEQVEYTPTEEEQKQPGYDQDIRLRPKIGQYSLRVLSPRTGKITDVFDLEPNEMITSLVCAPLEISENTHRRKEMVAVGTMMQRGESNASKGAVYVFGLIDVVPEPDEPETGKRLQLVIREETKTGITAMMGIDGMLGTAQVLKLMFRGLKEESNQCLPVAFLDAPCYTTMLKTLRGTNLWLAADAWKGLWFGGFSEDPYKISLFGQSRPNLEIVAADFLPFEQNLYMAVLDADSNLHMLQYDPENPKTMYGKRLLHRSTFHTGHLATRTHLVPSSTGRDHVLITHADGCIGLLTPLDEIVYRRLSALQASMTLLLEQVAGLNPRAYRNASVEDAGIGLAASGARACVDGDVIARIAEFGAGKRAEVLHRVGVESMWGLRADLELVTGEGLRYF